MILANFICHWANFNCVNGQSTFSLKEAETSGRDIEVHPIKAIKEDYVLRRYGKNVKMPTSPARKHRG